MMLGEIICEGKLFMRLRIVYLCLIPLLTVFLSVLPSQPASAAAQVGFSSTGLTSGSYNAAFFEVASTFLTNATVDELVSVSIRVVGSSSMTLSLYNSDVAGNRGTFITNIATLPITTEQIYTFTPSSPIFLQPNSYYWIETDFPSGAYAMRALPTSDYYTFDKSWLYDIGTSTFLAATTTPFTSLLVNTTDTLSASAACDVNADLSITIASGDANFSITGTGAGLPTTVTGSTILNDDNVGPNSWSGVTITELGGNGESFTIGDVTCNAFSLATQTCNGDDVNINITSGDFPMTLTDVGLNQTVTSTGTVVIPGPISFAGITQAETTGDLQSRTFVSISCPVVVTAPLNASATCIGANLQVTITSGDIPLELTADSGLLQTGFSTGILGLTGPLNETNLTLTELGGDAETLNLGDFNCFASSALSATAVCNGANLEINITNGNAPFSISVTDSLSTMDSGGNPLGVYTFTGPDTFINIGITEDSGDLEVLNFPDVTCTAPVIPPVLPPAPVVLSPDLTALGCVLTQDVLAPTAPDNTYCRILMKNGGVVNYAGAVPQSLINLGVIYAVDVYRLEGGRSITTFPNYTQVCLAGQGRLFYLDARTSPRTQTELTTETLDGMTCGWIPAVGTLVLTQ